MRLVLRLCAFNIFYIPLLLNAQNCNLKISGSVRDEDNSENLAFAYVMLNTKENLQQTNDRGEFAFENLCPGSYTLKISHPGCHDTSLVIDLQQSRRISLKLPHSHNALGDVDIITHREVQKNTIATESLDQKDLDKTRGASLADQLKQLNGVTTLNTGPTISKPIINGMQGYRILILNNGVRQEGQQWGTEHAPEIDPFVSNKLSVIRGAASVRYGSDAIGGVVLAEMGELPDTACIGAELNLVGASNGRAGATSLMLQGYFDKVRYLSWRVQGTLKKNGSMHTPDYYLKNTGSEEKNFSYALDYHRKKIGLSVFYAQYNSRVGIFSGAHIGNLTDLQRAFNSTKPQDSLAPFSYEIEGPYQTIEHELIKLNADIHTGPRSRINMSYSWQYNIRKEFDHDAAQSTQSNETVLPESDYRISSNIAELSWEHDYIKSFRGKFGLQGMYQFNHYKQQYFIPNYYNHTAGIFAIERRVRPNYELEAGARYDVKRLQSFYYEGQVLQEPDLYFGNASFNLGAILKPDSKNRISFNLGSGWRAPAPNELYSNGLHHGVGAIEKGDKNLQTEKCLNAVLAYGADFKGLHLEATAFQYIFSNYIYYTPGNSPELTVRGAFPVFNYTQNDAKISGADLLAKWMFSKHLGIKARGMMVRGTNTDLQQALIYMPADRAETGVILNFSDAKKIHDIYLEPSLLFVAKQIRIPEQADFVSPPPSYYLFGLNAGASLIAGKQLLIFTFSISNAANTVYRDYLDRFRYYCDAAGVNYTLRLRMPIDIYDKKK